MKKFLFFIIVLFIVGYMGIIFVVKTASREALKVITEQSKNYGVEILGLNFQEVGISSLSSITYRGIGALWLGKEKNKKGEKTQNNLNIDRLTLNFGGGGSQFVEAENISYEYARKTIPGPTALENVESNGEMSGIIEGDRFFMAIKIDLLDPLPGLKNINQEITSLIKSGKTKNQVDFKGKLKFKIRETPLTIGVRIEKRNDFWVLLLNRQDIKKASELFKDILTETEIFLIAENPAQAQDLLRIKDYANSKSEQAHKENKKVPEDAYRHVLWSYKLTKKFGEKFAKKFTDAHEQGLTGNTPSEKKMDYNNNNVGRRYAKDGVEESFILRLVQTDPSVIRKP